MVDLKKYSSCILLCGFTVILALSSCSAAVGSGHPHDGMSDDTSAEWEKPSSDEMAQCESAASQPPSDSQLERNRKLQAELDKLNRDYNPNIDLDGDGVEESVSYDPIARQLCVSRDGKQLNATDVSQFHMTFNNTGFGLLNYSYSFAKDRDGMVLLHITWRTLIDDTHDLVVDCNQDYYSFQEEKWIEKHTIHSTEINETSDEDVTLDDQPMENLESAFRQFTEIEHSHYKIPTDLYEAGWDFPE